MMSKYLFLMIQFDEITIQKYQNKGEKDGDRETDGETRGERRRVCTTYM